MKTLPTDLATHVALGSTTLAYLLKITRLDAAVYAFTSADADVTVSSVTYLAAPGLTISSLETSAGLNVDNLELTTLDDGSTFTRMDVLGGLWRNAAFEISRYNHVTPVNGLEPLIVGTVGEVRLGRGMITAELRGLQQYLQQPVGAVSSKTCRARLGDAMCGINLASYTYTGSVTAVTSRQIFTGDANPAVADAAMTDGIVTFTSGNNAGLSQKVKSFDGTLITLGLPMLQAIQIGDDYTFIAGCKKRLAEDCFTTFNNVLNFQGEPHLPGIDEMTSPP